MDGGDTWQWDIDGDGYGEIYSTHPNLSFASDDPDVVWAVISMADVGDYVSDYQMQEATNCRGWDTYIPAPSDYTNWSFDLWVLKSTDGGATWSDPANATNTAGDFLDGVYNGPEEMYPHTPAFSTSENVYFMYQMPNWEWNEIGDPTAPDHMNYVYVGFSDGAQPDLAIDEEDSIEESIIPGSFELTQNYPNPFNPSTSINFTVPSLSDVNISVYDINGRLVNTLISNTLAAGTYDVVWNGDDMTGNSVSAGIYIYNLTSGETSITNKMILVK